MKLGARVELLHVIERRLLVGDFITHFTEVFRRKIDGSFAEWTDKDPNCLKEAEEYLSRLPVSYELHYLRGDTHAVILQHASEKGCDLLSMGAFTNLISDALARGAATETILWLSQIPALIHR